MLQVKDPQEVFDEIVKTALKEELQEDVEFLEQLYKIFILGTMFGNVDMALGTNQPIPSQVWDNPLTKSFIRGDVNDVVVVDDNTPAKPVVENKGLIIIP